MYVRKEAREYIDGYQGVKRIAAKLCIKINAPIIRMLNWEFDKVRAHIEKHDGYFEKLWSMQRQLKEYESTIEKVKDISSRLDKYETITGKMKNIIGQLEDYKIACENIEKIERRLEEHVAVAATDANKDHIKLDKIEDTLAMYRVKMDSLQKLLHQNNAQLCQTVGNDVDGTGRNQAVERSITGPCTEDAYGGIDYFDFENHFRGTMAEIKQNQAIYLKYFTGKAHVVDLGCGRGEFLELLKENGISSCGVDMYQEFVDLCHAKGLEVVQGDALAFLEQEVQVEGIFAAQLIEHLTLQQLIRLIEVSYEKLERGCYLVMETPNPTSLSIYNHAFYIDPSHEKPRHPLTMSYLLKKAGFREVDFIFTESSKVPVKIPMLKIDNVEGIDAFNEAMREVERTLYGSQDYAIIAKK